MTRLLSSVSLGACLLLGCEYAHRPEIAAFDAAQPIDVLIHGGMVIDGTGSPARRADVAVADGRIIYVGEIDPATAHAGRVIDATGSVVTPGFMDTHSHGNPRETPEFENCIAQGVTTVVLGQDGDSPRAQRLEAWFTSVEAARPGPNIATLLGHGTVREEAGVGLDPEPTAEQKTQMSELVEQGLDAGAFGVSSGLEYDPGRFAPLSELVAVARPVGRHGGIVASHMRSEDVGEVEGAVAELLAQCREGGCGAHVSHIKVVGGHGEASAEAVLAELDAARQMGMQVTADIYPYIASNTGIAIVYPDWARPPFDFDQVARERRADLEAYLRQRIAFRNGPGATLFTGGEHVGQTLAEVASAEGKPFEDVLIDEFPPGSVSAAYFVMDEATMRRFLRDPHVMICSDGSPDSRHPRGFGSFARVIHEYCMTQHLFPLEEAIRKMTSLPADTLGISDRGRVAEGMAADLVVFDPAKVRDTATFEDPQQLAEGFDTVLVNGQVVRAGGEFTGVRAGHVLRAPN